MSGQIYKVQAKFHFKTKYFEEHSLEPTFTAEVGFARVPCIGEQITPFLYPDLVFEIYNIRWIGTHGFKAVPLVSANQL